MRRRWGAPIAEAGVAPTTHEKRRDLEFRGRAEAHCLEADFTRSQPVPHQCLRTSGQEFGARPLPISAAVLPIFDFPDSRHQ